MRSGDNYIHVCNPKATDNSQRHKQKLRQKKYLKKFFFINQDINGSELWNVSLYHLYGNILMNRTKKNFILPSSDADPGKGARLT